MNKKPTHTIVLTGAMSMSRSEIEAAIKASGHFTKGAVGAGVTHLCQADPDSHTVKTKKALALGIEVIDEEQLWDLID